MIISLHYYNGITDFIFFDAYKFIFVYTRLMPRLASVINAFK